MHADTALRWRRANTLIASGKDIPAIWEDISKAAEQARESELLYYYNHDEDYTIGGKAAQVATSLTSLAEQLLDKTGLTADQIQGFNGPFPEAFRKLAQPAGATVWDKLTDLVPARPARIGEVSLRTSIGLSNLIDYFCLGTVFSIQLHRSDEWQTIFRRAVLKKDSGWQEWDVPLGPMEEKPGEPLRLRLVTDSYTRAHDRNWPTWKWGFWGAPCLVRRDPSGQGTVLYDFCSEIPAGHRSIVLDKDGVARDFDRESEDSTGAMFKAIEPSAAEQENAPLPARPCIAAFAPYRNGAFGITLAEFEIGLRSTKKS